MGFCSTSCDTSQAIQAPLQAALRRNAEKKPGASAVAKATKMAKCLKHHPVFLEKIPCGFLWVITHHEPSTTHGKIRVKRPPKNQVSYLP